MIQTQAMLATLSISQWTARKQDKAITAEVEKAHAAHDAGRFNKLLVSKALLDPIAKLAGQVRDYHYSVTLPWSDTGARLLPSKLFMAYTDKLRTFRQEFERLVQAMVHQYPTEVQAARNRLGTMYNPGDYPEPWQLKDRFQIALDFTPVPSAQDFRLDVSAEAQDELRASVTAAVAAKQAQAVKATFARVREVVSKIAERLSDDKAVFKDSLIDNARDLCDVLDALNITGDEQLADVQRMVQNELIVSPFALRNDLTLRREVARRANAILSLLP